MRKVYALIFSCLFLIHYTSSAQDGKSDITYGIKAGINIANIKIKAGGATVTASSLVAPTGGFFVNLPVAGGFSIQPELLYSGLGTKSEGDKIVLGYLSLPVLAKYSFEKTGFAAYLGPQIGYLLSAKAKSGGVSEDAKEGFNKADFSGVVGVEYTFTPPIILSVRYQEGFSNIAKGTQDELQGGSLKNHAITFTIGYRF